jgi:hypothetical protein
MRFLIRAGQLGVLAVLAGVIAAGASASSPARCRASQLTATMTHIPFSEGAGNTGYLLKLRNVGATRCRLGNHPRLRLLGTGGRALPTHVSTFGRSGTVTIAPHRSASARLRFSPDILGPGEPAHGPCEPKAHAVRVTLTAPAHGSTVGPVKPPTSVCEHGSMQEQPLS